MVENDSVDRSQASVGPVRRAWHAPRLIRLDGPARNTEGTGALMPIEIDKGGWGCHRLR